MFFRSHESLCQPTFICYRGDLLSNLFYVISGDRDHFNITKTLYAEKCQVIVKNKFCQYKITDLTPFGKFDQWEINDKNRY